MKLTGDGNCGAEVSGRLISVRSYDLPVVSGVGVGVCARNASEATARAKARRIGTDFTFLKTARRKRAQTLPFSKCPEPSIGPYDPGSEPPDVPDY